MAGEAENKGNSASVEVEVGVEAELGKNADRILTSLDTNNVNEAYAVVTHLIDWSQAFDRQCSTLRINSFIKNGVRKSLIPVLINYFQD